MHQICVASAHCRGRTGCFQEAFHVMTLPLSRDGGWGKGGTGGACPPTWPQPGFQAPARRGGCWEPGLVQQQLSAWKLVWCEMGICVLATTQVLGGCFLSFAAGRLWWGAALWQALMTSQEAGRACPRHTLLAWPWARAPVPRGRRSGVVTLYVRAHSGRPCLIQILRNSRLIFL